MKSLDERLSTIVSPFEDSEQDQQDVVLTQYLAYRKDSLIEAIGKKTGYQEFDLFFEDVLEESDSDDTLAFLTDCLKKLAEVYPIDVMLSNIEIENIRENDPDSIISLIKFFVYDEWQKSLIRHIPIFEIRDLEKRELLHKKVKDTYLSTQEKIIKDVDIHPLIRNYFEYCPYSDGIKMLMIFIFRDIPGVVSQQLVLTTGVEK